MINFDHILFSCDQLTVPVSVPRYWVDDAVFWDDDTPFDAPVEVRGVFSNRYRALDLATAAQDAAMPRVLIQTAAVPFARESNDVTITVPSWSTSGVRSDVDTTYHVATVEPDGAGVTTITLYQ